MGAVDTVSIGARTRRSWLTTPTVRRAIMPLVDAVAEAIRHQMPTDSDPTALFTGPAAGSGEGGEQTAV
jgi:hypothetical protein